MSSGRPIIVIKKKGGHGGHHGGAWKVAYADFVTAMMALFIVLWLMNTNQQIQEAVAGYFKDPAGIAGKHAGNTDSKPTKQDMAQVKEELQKALTRLADFEKLKKQVEFTVTPEGLRIDMLETESGTFFDSGSPVPNASGKELLVALSAEMAKLPNKISIEGHTDSRPYAGGGAYTNWELSADRANSARRLMQGNGLRPDQVSQVRGFADQRLRKPSAPEDPSNRRISLIVEYLPKDDPKKGDAEKEAQPKPSESAPSHGEEPPKH